MDISFNYAEITAFRSLGESQRVELKQNTIYSLIGQNEDDGGSNGSAKTSIVMAIAVGLYGADAAQVPISELKNRNLDIPTRIIVSLNINDKELIVDRTLGGKLRIKFATGDWEEGKSSDLQDKINHYIGLTSTQFLALSYKQQGDFTGFLLKKSSEKIDFINSFIADLGVIESAAEAIAIEFKNISTNLVTKEAQHLSQLAVLDEKRATLAQLELKKPSSEVYTHLESLKAQAASMDEAVTSIKNQPKTSPADIPGYSDLLDKIFEESLVAESLKQEQQKVVAALSQIDATVKAQKAALEPDIQLAQTALRSAQAELAKLDIEISKKASIDGLLSFKKVRAGELMQQRQCAGDLTCSHCTQKLPEDKVAGHIAKIDSDIEAITKEVGQYFTQLKAIEQSESLRTALAPQVLALQARQTELIDAQRAINAGDTYVSLSANQGAINSKMHESQMNAQSIKTAMAKLELEDSAKRKEQISSIEMGLMATKGQIAQLTVSISNYESGIVQAGSSIEKTELVINQVESELSKLTADLNVVQQVKDVLARDGFLSYLFDGILDSLNAESNNNLQMIPNTQKFSILFSPEKTAKTTGAVSKTISYTLQVDGQDVSVKSLSGGEQLGLLIAVDEALDTVISQRLGVNLRFKFLDEQFSFIDNHSKESILEFYRAKSATKTYVIIDHASEFNAAIDNQIIVTKKNKNSTVVVT